MEPLSINVTGVAAARLVYVSGEVDLATVPLLDRALREIDDGSVTVALDDVTFLDASGLRCLVQAHQRLSEAGGTLRVVGGAPIVRRIFDITGLDHLLAEALPRAAEAVSGHDVGRNEPGPAGASRPGTASRRLRANSMLPADAS